VGPHSSTKYFPSDCTLVKNYLFFCSHNYTDKNIKSLQLTFCSYVIKWMMRSFCLVSSSVQPMFGVCFQCKNLTVPSSRPVDRNPSEFFTIPLTEPLLKTYAGSYSNNSPIIQRRRRIYRLRFKLHHEDFQKKIKRRCNYNIK
jgi:hypothetical protein